MKRKKKNKRKFERDGNIQEETGTELVGDEIPVTKTDNKDYILEETAKVLSDFILLTIG